MSDKKPTTSLNDLLGKSYDQFLQKQSKRDQRMRETLEKIADPVAKAALKLWDEQSEHQVKLLEAVGRAQVKQQERLIDALEKQQKSIARVLDIYIK